MLENSLRMSHLLFGVVVWGSELPAVLTLCPSPYNSLAAQMQHAFLMLLRWAMQVPHDICIQLLHLLANQPPIGRLVAKQMVYYAQSLKYELDEADSQALGHQPLRHAYLVWHAI